MKIEFRLPTVSLLAAVSLYFNMHAVFYTLPQ